MRVVLLGELAIARGGGAPMPPATLSGRRSELVFAYLAVEHRRTVTRDELADALWPGMLPDSWAAALRTVITDVRRFLESAGLDPATALVTERSGYRLRLPAGAVLDVDEAHDALAAARERLTGGDAAAAAVAAGRAAELAGRGFLSHHDGEWVDGVRGELDTLRERALELQTRALIAAGDPVAAAEASERLVRVDPFNDAAQRLRIEALAAAGDRAGALKAYERYAAALRSQLGVAPSPETEAVLRRALGTAVGGADRPASAAAEPLEPASGLAGLSVLVVEDHDFQRRTAVALLRRLGVGTVAEAADGLAALDHLARSTAPDVIVCDIDMPGMDGVEFIRNVAQRRLASAVAIASALDAAVLRAVQAVAEGYGLQVLGVVEKPVTVRRLGELLAAYRRPAARSVVPADVSATALVEALAAGRLRAECAPIVDLASGRMGGAQALPRWDGGSAIAMADLEPVLVAEDLAARFVDALVATTCDQQRALDGDGLRIDGWVTLPGAAIVDLDLADRIAAVVAAHAGDPRRIVCTVALDALHGERAAALDTLTRLRVKGFGLCLDDFGVDGRAADHLRRLPLTAVRLATELLAGGGAGDLQGAVDAATAQGLLSVGNGCATAADFELLLQVGCSHGQGRCIGEPMAAGELAGWAQRWRPPPLVVDGRS